MLLGVAVAAAPAQAQKLGYVDQQAVLFSMPGMQDVQQEMQKEMKQQQRQLQQQRQEMMQPLLEKLQGAIDKVSAQQDLEAVFRREVLLYDDQTSDQVVDITRDVASELGISLSQTPGEPSPTLDQQAPPAGGGGGDGQ